MSRYRCPYCAFVYDEAEGVPEEGIAPGTLWNALPEDWICPQCGVDHAEFMIEE